MKSLIYNQESLNNNFEVGLVLRPLLTPDGLHAKLIVRRIKNNNGI